MCDLNKKGSLWDDTEPAQEEFGDAVIVDGDGQTWMNEGYMHMVAEFCSRRDPEFNWLECKILLKVLLREARMIAKLRMPSTIEAKGFVIGTMQKRYLGCRKCGLFINRFTQWLE